MASDHVPVNLTGVPETLLWNLYFRAVAARDPRRTGLDDPEAIEIVDRLDYPFARFDGARRSVSAQWHALRVRTFDDEIRRLLARHPESTVVALGEGLETQFWRVDNGRMNWVSVDVAETVELRRTLLPDGPRRRTVVASATDPAWTDQIDHGNAVLITAQGLLMYFARGEVETFISMCAARLPGALLLFDAVPSHMARARERWGASAGESGYQPPAWTWTPTAEELRGLAAVPGVAELVRLRPPRGRGVVFGAILPVLQRVPGIRDALPSFPVMRARLE